MEMRKQLLEGVRTGTDSGRRQRALSQARAYTRSLLLKLYKYTNNLEVLFKDRAGFRRFEMGPEILHFQYTRKCCFCC